MNGRSAPMRAFTLVEVMVTVTVIAILIGVLLPALRTAHGVSRQTACTSNLRQLIFAATAYCASNREAMPPAILYFQQQAFVRTVAWDFETEADGQVVPGPLWQYTNTPLQVQQCPDFEGASTFGTDPYSGYNYNTTFIGHEGGYPMTDDNGRVLDGWGTARLGTPIAAFARPDRTAVFGDGGWIGGANKFMRAPLNTVEGSLPLVCAGAQAFRHTAGCTCCAYLDGHVGIVQQPARGALTTPALASSVTGFPFNGFLSEDDSAYGPK